LEHPNHPIKGSIQPTESKSEDLHHTLYLELPTSRPPTVNHQDFKTSRMDITQIACNYYCFSFKYMNDSEWYD